MPWKVSGSGARIRARTSSSSTCSDGSPRRERAGEPLTPTTSPRWRSSARVRSEGQISWIRPERSTRSQKTSFPMSRRAITRPARRRFVPASVEPGSSASASARTAAASTRLGKRFGAAMAAESSGPRPDDRPAPVCARGRRRAAERLGRLDLHDLELPRPPRRRRLDDVALLVPHDRLADRRLVRELHLGRVRLGRADDVVLDRLVRGHVLEAHLGSYRDLARADLLLRHDARVLQPFLERRDPRLEVGLVVLRRVVLGVLGDVAELARGADPLGHLAAAHRRQVLDLLLELLVALRREDDFLHHVLLDPEIRNGRWRMRPAAGADGTPAPGVRQQPRGYDPAVPVDLRESWSIGPVEVPTRIVLAPMAGVSIQAFRRQGRRFGAGLVCSEMVSAAGIEHRNERTFGYLRVASDEHPLAIQIFGAEPRAMADAARLVEAAGADIVDLDFGCPVRKVTKTGAGAHLLADQELACRIVEAVAAAVSLPVTVKMRRGVEHGSRACLELGPRLVEAGAAALTLHPRSATQMYTGEADHALTAELVQRVGVPVIASGARAIEVLEQTGAAAVMVARGAQGNPWALREIAEGEAFRPTREEVAAELIVFVREAVRELGERRAVGFLKKFYGWYLGHGRFPKPFKQQLVQLATTEEVVLRLLAAAPAAAALVERLEAELPPAEDEVVLDRLPISLYGGG